MIKILNSVAKKFHLVYLPLHNLFAARNPFAIIAVIISKDYFSTL